MTFQNSNASNKKKSWTFYPSYLNACLFLDVNVFQESWSPQFNGTSYIELQPLEGLGKAFRIEIWFLTNRFSGMLLYTGQSNKAKGDFIAINLVNGYLQFRYNLGSGIANIT